MPRNGDGLFKKGRIWYFKFRSLEDRAWKDISTGTAVYADARRFKHEYVEKAKNGLLPTYMADWTLQQALEAELEYVQATKCASTLPPYRTSVEHLRATLGANKVLKTITADDLRAYQIARRRSGRAPKTINNEVLILRAVMKRAKLWPAIEPDYKPLKVPKNGPGVAITAEQAERLFSLSNARPGWFVGLRAGVLAFATGCRTGEVRRLQLRDLDLNAAPPLMRIRRETTKTDAGAREVVMNQMAVWAASELLNRAKLLGASLPTDYMLPANLSRHTKANDPLQALRGYDVTRPQGSWQSAWENLRAAAGLPDLRFHDLRHSFITHAIEAGVPIEVVMAQVGHVSAEMTRYYTHLGSRARERASSAVESRNTALMSMLKLGRPTGELDVAGTQDHTAASSTLPEAPQQIGAEVVTKLAAIGPKKLAALLALIDD